MVPGLTELGTFLVTSEDHVVLVDSFHVVDNAILAIIKTGNKSYLYGMVINSGRLVLYWSATPFEQYFYNVR